MRSVFSHGVLHALDDAVDDEFEHFLCAESRVAQRLCFDSIPSSVPSGWHAPQRTRNQTPFYRALSRTPIQQDHRRELPPRDEREHLVVRDIQRESLWRKRSRRAENARPGSWPRVRSVRRVGTCW